MKQESKIRLSLVIPAKDKNDPKLADLLASIDSQDFPKEQMETLVITDGTSESAKAIGIRKAKGEVIGILASDNELVEKDFLNRHFLIARQEGSAQPCYYYYTKKDDILNRYFALFGCNDPLAFYMDKNDKLCRVETIGRFLDMQKGGTIGDNGYFVRKDLIEKTDLDNYYHIDNAVEAMEIPFTIYSSIWHKTGGNIFKFFQKRFRYGLQHAFNKNRRWHLVDFSRKEDICRLVWFIIASLTVVHPLLTSIRGYLKVRDLAWFLHPIVCGMTLLTYSVLMIHVGWNRLLRLSFAPTVVPSP